MKKTRKHRFTHSDPEQATITENTNKKSNRKTGDALVDGSQMIIRKDLQRVILTIVAFLVLLLTFYYINLKYDLLNHFIRILGL